ncbi:MAG: T9SS type A sorting domain-containing protein [Flavobacteriales bacterium]|nr:T9SS type A sorting domain-containing protein [Flavobacteriales bacterium]
MKNLITICLFLTPIWALSQFQFTNSPLNTNGESKAVWASGDTAFVGFDDKLLRTLYGGNTWEHLTNGIPETCDPRTINVSEGHLIVGTNSGNRTYMSEDWGDTFDNGSQSLSPLLIPTHGIGGPGIEMIGGTLHGPHSFDTETETWTEAEAGGSLTHGLDLVAENEIWQCAGGVTSGVTKYSTDLGQSWTTLPTEPQVDIGGGILFSAIGQGFAKVGDRILLGTNITGFPVIYSDDYGVTWTPADLPSTTYSDYGQRFLKVNDDHLLTVNVTGVWKSTDQGATWELIRTLAQINSMAIFRGNHLLISTQNGVCEFENYGEGEFVAKPGLATHTSNLVQYDGLLLATGSDALVGFDPSTFSWETLTDAESVGYEIGNEYVAVIGDSTFICGANILSSLNGSYDFQPRMVGEFGGHYPNYIAQFGDRKIICGRHTNILQGPKIWTSDDNGINYTESSWTNNVAYGLGGIVDNHIENILSLDGTLYADMSAGYAVSTDNGSTWTHYGDTNSNNILTVHNGYVYRYLLAGFFQDEKSLTRSQNGIDWEDVPTTGLTSENDYQGIWSLNGSLYTYNDFNTPFGLYKWNDQSASWELQIGTVGPNYPFLDQLYQFDGAFYGLWFNGGVWTVSGEPDNVLEYELEATIYPNPAADQLTIQTSSTPEQIMIFDQQGRIISTHYNISQLDVSALSTGIYYVRISLNNQEVIKRLIIN